jgi:hypothetical protein
VTHFSRSAIPTIRPNTQPRPVSRLVGCSRRQQVWLARITFTSRVRFPRRRDSEHEALKSNKVKALYIRQSGNAAELYADAARIIKQWPKVQAWGEKAKPGTLARLDSSDRIVQLG